MAYDPAGPGNRDEPSPETSLPGEQTTPDPIAEDAGASLDRFSTHIEQPAADAGYPTQGSPFFVDAPSDDPHGDVPASLELAYTSADVGLSDRAYERAIPYERVERRRRGARSRKVARELVETVILALLIFFAVRAVVQNFRVEGASMEPSMHNDQYLLVNKAIFYRLDLGRLNEIVPFLPGDENDGESHLFRAPRRGDIIVFRYPLDPSRDFIKRVIGVPNDVVEIRDEQVIVNGIVLEENYILATSNYTYGPREVPEGMFFVLGDNRRNSFDSHAWGNSCAPEQNCEFVPEENIIGQAWVSYWPFENFGLLPNKNIHAP